MLMTPQLRKRIVCLIVLDALLMGAMLTKLNAGNAASPPNSTPASSTLTTLAR